MFTFLEERSRRLLATLTAVAMLAGLSVIGVLAPAQAAPTPAAITGGSLTWGYATDYRTDLPASPATRSATGGASFVSGDVAQFPAATSSTWDGTIGNLQFQGDVRFGYQAGPSGNFVTLSNPKVSITGSTGVLSAVSSSKSHGVQPDAPSADRVLANLDLSAAVKTEDATSVTWTGVTAAVVAAGQPVLLTLRSGEAAQRPVGEILDPLTITLTKQAPAAPTATSLTASAASSQLGSSVTLTATVAPAAAGTVTFFTGAVPLGAPVPVTAGSAALPTTQLPLGVNALTATFTPTDATAFESSTSSAVTHTVNPVTVPTVWTPAISVFAADGVTPLGTTPVAIGDTIVVKGTGFDPAANVGGRGAPIPNTLPQGSYVVFGSFASSWRPSTGALPATRTVGPQAWALTEDTVNQVPPRYEDAVRAQWTPLSAAGTFSATLTLTDLAALDGGTYGVYTYGAGGINNAAQELKVAVNFVNEVVAPATTTTTAISAAPATVTAGGTSSLIATVTPAGAAGTVEFFSGSTLLGSAPLAQGAATFPTAALALGEHTFTARFVPSDAAVFAPSTTTVGVTVTATAPVDGGGIVTPPANAAGQLVWGVKASFTSYITGGAAAGSIAVSGGAATSGNAFTFGQASKDFNGSTGTVGYAGSVRFTGHAGALDLKLTNPRIKVTGPLTATLLVDVVGKGLTGGSVDKAGVEFATLALGASTTKDGATTWTNAAATLTAAGSDAFSGFYPAGTALDPVSFSVGADKAPGETPEVPSVPPVAALPAGIYKNATVNVPTILPGGEVTVTGTGFGANTTGIDLAVYSVRQVLATGLTADANGNVKATVTLPKNLAAGVHTLSFEAPNGVTSQVSITVEAPAAVAKQCLANAVSGATLSWGVKSAFRTYITGPIANGAITTSGVSDSGSVFGWSGGKGSFNTEVNQGRVSFGGSVNFSGHGGILDLTLSNVRVQVTGASTGSLIADVSSTDMSGAKSSQTGVVVATLNLSGKKSTSGSTVTWSNVPASLTAAGAKAFAGSYVAGEALDPVTFSFPLGATVECDASSGALAVTGADGLADAALLALAAMTFGLGLMMVARRRRTSVQIG